MTDDGRPEPSAPPLPRELVRLTRSGEGVTLYFPPLRNPGAAIMLALFGVSCFIPGVFAALAMVPFSGHGPGGMIALWLMSIFILPFVAFGCIFVALAIYQVSNSLAVSVTAGEIRTERRVFGVSLGTRRVASVEVTAIDALPALRYRLPREATTHYDLVARLKGGNAPVGLRTRRLVVAESLRGEALMEQVRTEIARTVHLEAPSAASRGAPADRK